MPQPQPLPLWAGLLLAVASFAVCWGGSIALGVNFNH